MMKTAYWKNEYIELEHWPKEAYTRVHEAGKNGELHCSSCHQAVIFYLGIHDEPHFIHKDPSVPPCPELPKNSHSAAEAKEETTDYGGFRLPKSRSISTNEENKESDWQSPFHIKNLPPFVLSAANHQSSCHPFTQTLKEHGWTLDEEQSLAVTTDARHLLVLAGAGSGKTRVLTSRTAFLLLEKKVNPKSIMLVTFTSKAAAEMKERLTRMPGMGPSTLQQLYTGTFHAIFYRILMHHDPDKWHSSKLIKFDGEKEYILKIAASELGIDEREFAFDACIQQIGKWKNDLYLPNDVRPDGEFEHSALELYKKYEQYKETHDKFDFDDMQTGCYTLLKSDPALLSAYQSRFRYFLLDEFQDINRVQYEVMRLLTDKAEHICFVGDDDQAIYSFRGSDSSFLLNLSIDFPDLETVYLAANYRSGHKIVQTANQIIAQNHVRTQKKMRALHDQSPAPVLFYPHDEEMESVMIMTDIMEKIRNGASPNDFAILYRTNVMSRAIFERLAVSSLPFRVDADYDSFYNRRAVKGILAFLKASLNPDDPSMLNDLLPPLYLRKTAVQDAKALSILNDCSLLEALPHIGGLKPFQKKTIEKAVSIIGTLKNIRPDIAIETIEKELGFQNYLKKRGNEGNKMDKGSDEIKDVKVAASKFNSVQAFVDHATHMVAMSKEVKKRSKTEPFAIQLGTIHRSKGLEYKYVYLLGCVEGCMPHDYALEAWREGDRKPIEEERRLLYVAVTRACSELYMSVSAKRRGKAARPSRFLNNLKKGAPLAAR